MFSRTSQTASGRSGMRSRMGAMLAWTWGCSWLVFSHRKSETVAMSTSSQRLVSTTASLIKLLHSMGGTLFWAERVPDSSSEKQEDSLLPSLSPGAQTWLRTPRLHEQFQRPIPSFEDVDCVFISISDVSIHSHSYTQTWFEFQTAAHAAADRERRMFSKWQPLSDFFSSIFYINVSPESHFIISLKRNHIHHWVVSIGVKFSWHTTHWLSRYKQTKRNNATHRVVLQKVQEAI